MQSMTIECRQISLRDVRRLPPIPSGFLTDRVFRLIRDGVEGEIRWTLSETGLPTVFQKQYDSGSVDELLETYADAGTPKDLRFVAAWQDDEAKGLMTWRRLDWNRTAWLLDIRTRGDARRRGVGSVLLDFLKAQVRKERLRGVFLETQINNYPAICFYRKNGFEIAGFNDHLYTNEDRETQDIALFLFWRAE